MDQVHPIALSFPVLSCQLCQEANTTWADSLAPCSEPNHSMSLTLGMLTFMKSKADFYTRSPKRRVDRIRCWKVNVSYIFSVWRQKGK